MKESNVYIGLRYVGDPLIDNGVAVLTSVSGEASPEKVTYEQIAPFIQEIQRIYITPFMSNYLGAVVFANVDFANPYTVSKRELDGVRQRRLEIWFSLSQGKLDVLDQLDAKDQKKIELADNGERCIFSGDPALVRLSRTLIPMTSSEDAINFVPQGRPRLPISGWCLLALLVMPMASLNSEGKVLLVHTSDRKLQQVFAKLNLQRNRQDMLLAGLESRPNYKFARTQIISELLDIRRGYSSRYPLTVYKFTSSGKSSSVVIYQLSSSVLMFIDSAQRLYPSAWAEVIKRAWHKNPKDEQQKKGEITDLRHNYFYEDLFDLPARSRAFLKLYLLRQPLRKGKSGKGDPRQTYSPLKEREVISWDLIGLFLEKVMDMEKIRLEAIKTVADRLADYIQRHDHRLYGKLYSARRPDQVRMVLIRAANRARDKEGALLPLDEFVQVFFVDEGNFWREDWFLAYDLLLIRLIEQLSSEVIDENRSEIEAHDQKAETQDDQEEMKTS